MTTAYLVVPCYNEEAVLPETVKRLTEKLRGLIASGRAGEDSRILLVDDGSKDRTWELIAGSTRKTAWFPASSWPTTGGIRTPCWPV